MKIDTEDRVKQKDERTDERKRFYTLLRIAFYKSITF